MSGVAYDGDVQLFEVKLLSGQPIEVQTTEERDWFTQTQRDYQENVSFTEVTDLRDLDRLMIFELVVFRLTRHLGSGKDYDGFLIDTEDAQKKIQRASAEITKIKASMGLNKASRDAAEAAGNFADWLSNAKRRAQEFGQHRNKQVTKVLALFNELSAIVGTFDRSDEEEREKMGFRTEAEILEWIRETAIPEFEDIDKEFRRTSQRYWVKDL